MAALLMKGVTATPVVFVNVSDPVALGLVRSLPRPSTHMTGLADLTGELDSKRVELVREALPRLHRLATLMATNTPRTSRFHVARESARPEAEDLRHGEG